MNVEAIVNNLLEADVNPDDPNVFLRHYGGKPYGYVLRSKIVMSGYPWLNPDRLGDREGQCGSFFKSIYNAKVFKRKSTTLGYSGCGLDVVPVYSNPRRTGLKALDPNYSEQCFRCGTRVNGDLRAAGHTVCGKCLFQYYRRR